MTNKPMLSVERELLERAVFKMPFCDARYDLQSILDTPVIGRKPVAWLVEDIYGQKKALRSGAEGIERHRKSGSTLIPLFDNSPSHNVVCECWYTDECGNIRYRPEEVKPVPVAVLMPFAEKVISKLRRFQECADDGQGADIGLHWFDTLTQLGLLNRALRRPALWEMTQQGEDVLEVARLNGVKP